MANSDTVYDGLEMQVLSKIYLIYRNVRRSSALNPEVFHLYIAAFIIFIALCFRIFGLNWDDGYHWSPHPDERAILSKVASLNLPEFNNFKTLFIPHESPWNPRWFPYGSFPLYLLKGVSYISELATGEPSVDLRTLGRSISALADITTVALVFFVGRMIYGRTVGLLASLFTALAVIHIQLSHFFAVDTIQTLFAISALFFMYRISTTGTIKASIISGIFIGLGLSTKISQAPIYAPFVVSHLIYICSNSSRSTYTENWHYLVKSILIGSCVSVLIFFMSQPYALLDWSTFLGDVSEQSEMVRRIRDYPYTRQYIDTTAYWYQLRQLATWGLGWPLGIVAWSGLLYVYMRGLRNLYRIFSVLLGLILPMTILIASAHPIAVFVAISTSIIVLAASLPLRSSESKLDVLLLSWVIPYFLITGAFEVKFLRYLIPITPFLLLFGSKMLYAIWIGTNNNKILRSCFAVGLTILVLTTLFYAIAYISIYRSTHTAVQASEWINLNVDKGSLILKEHWEEGLPNLGSYKTVELPMYDPDTKMKAQLLAKELNRGDYMVLYSNRMYGTIPRLPERYPLSSKYYRQLFSGTLGYELVHYEAAYPNFLNIAFIHGTFRRPALPEPEELQRMGFADIELNFGFADESFSVYDHPLVLILKNSVKLDTETLEKLLSGNLPDKTHELPYAKTALMLSSKDVLRQQSGGTWTDIVKQDSWTNRFPVVAWLILIQVLGLLALPITFYIFRPLVDRGYLFSKLLGVFLVCLFVWLLASLKLLAFSGTSISMSILILTVVSVITAIRLKEELQRFVKNQWSLIIIAEFIFLAAFASFILIRMANPDLWHPIRGGEKPMDMAYLNAVLRSSFMPPYDPWFGGGYLNYYYWGQFIVANLIKSTGINPNIAFNLAIPTFFALTVSAVFTIVFNLVEGSRRALNERVLITNKFVAARKKINPGSVMAGMVAALFAAVIGNLDGLIQMIEGVWRIVFLDLPFGQFDFWRSSRMMPPDPPGFEINEFPFFTFLFADLHAHMMVIPMSLMTLALSYATIVSAPKFNSLQRSSKIETLTRLSILGISVGVLRLINAWDFPTYLLLSILSIYVYEYFYHGGLSVTTLLRTIWKSVFVFGIGYIIFLPYHVNYETFFNSLELTTNTTPWWQFLLIHGLFLFIIGSFFIKKSWGFLTDWYDFIGNKFSYANKAIDKEQKFVSKSNSGIGSVILWALTIAITLGIILTVLSLGFLGSTIPMVFILLCLILVNAFKWLRSDDLDSPNLVFVCLIIIVSLSLAIGLDIFRVENDIDRMNTIFKFYLQIWILLSIGSAYLLWRLAHGRHVPIIQLTVGKKFWVFAVVLLFVSSSIYTVAGTRDRLRDRFNHNERSLTLDGTDFVTGTIYQDPKGPVDLEADFEGINWLNQNVQGSPIILEAVIPTYQWGSRISVYTGLPTVIGWKWHQEQQRWAYRREVSNRIQDVSTMFSSTETELTVKLLKKYNVKYIYVGQVERLYYPHNGLEKFNRALAYLFEKIVVNDKVTIYRLKESML